MERDRDIFPLPYISISPPYKKRSRRVAARVSRLRKSSELANLAIRALNWMHGSKSEPGACPGSVSAPPSKRVSEIHTYFLRCSRQYVDCLSPRSATATKPDLQYTTRGSYDEVVKEAAVPIEAKLLSLPAEGGTFDARRYLGEELLEFMDAKPNAMLSPLVGSIGAKLARSYQSASEAEFVATIARLYRADMCALFAEAAVDVVGLFAQWKEAPSEDSDGSQRFLVDGRPPNCRFLTPSYEHTTGEDLVRQEAGEDEVLEMARADAADFFHTFRTVEDLQQYFGLRPVSAKALAKHGITVPPERVDSAGNTHPRLSTLPMGFVAAPAIAQGAHESVLYGAEGIGSDEARALPPALNPASRLSSRRQPEIDTPAAREPHVIVIDDVLCFRRVPRCQGHSKVHSQQTAAVQHAAQSAVQSAVQSAAQPAAQPPTQCAAQSTFQRVLGRYQDVDIRTKPSKVHDYASTQVGLGHLLDDNEFRTPPATYAEIAGEVHAMLRCGWARPRQVERAVGRLTSRMLLLRLTLSVFDAVYAFARKVGDRHARLWPAVAAELEHACALLPLMRADVTRRTAPCLVQCDACNDGDAVVYTESVQLDALRREALRPRTRLRDATDRWEVKQALSCGFDTPLEPELYKVAVRYRYPLGSASRARHINAKELGVVEKAVRWANRRPDLRGRRLIVQTDSAVAAGVVRKGRSSKRALKRIARRVAAACIAERLELVGRWIPTDRNMADQPSRGSLTPGPCLGVPVVRRRGRGQGGYAAMRVGEAKKPGPPEFWGPLLAATVNEQTSTARYGPAVVEFLRYVQECGEDLFSKDDADYWLAHYIHVEYAKGPTTRGTRKGHCRNAVYGLEHFYPAFKPLTVSRRCIVGWDRLLPPTPYAPMHLDVALALAAVMCLLGCQGAAVALLVSFDCWLRISEVSGLKARDVVDNRGQADPAGRGVAVYLETTKTGRRQAVIVESSEVAAILVAWRDAHRAQGLSEEALLFPAPDQLRKALAQALQGVGLAEGNDRGLHFSWHSCRHGGASRAFLLNKPMSDILLRGRWKAESSGRHYVQAGRQMLIGSALPPLITRIAQRVGSLGLAALLGPDFAARLDG